jgi:hypothetical protein
MERLGPFGIEFFDTLKGALGTAVPLRAVSAEHTL